MACLKSAADLVDEIVVVDTGSTDRTREIAFQHGWIVTAAVSLAAGVIGAALLSAKHRSTSASAELAPAG